MSEPQCKKSKMTSVLDQLKSMTTVVADTGDFQGKDFITINLFFFIIHEKSLQSRSQPQDR